MNPQGTNGEVQMSDPSIPDLDPEKSIPINKEELDDKGPPLNEDPKYMKFFTMLNMVRGYHMCTSCSYVSNQSYICHSS